MQLNFEKWQGTLNDFLIFYVDPRQDLAHQSLIKKAKELCMRGGKGIGADGMLIIGADQKQFSAKNTLPLTIVNADGTMAANCGNGLRCAAASVLRQRLQRDEDLSDAAVVAFRIADRDVELELQDPDQIERTSGRSSFLSANMGEVSLDAELDWSKDAQKKALALAIDVGIDKNIEAVFCASIGNPHLILFCHEPPERQAFIKYASQCQTKILDGGINIHAVWREEFSTKDRLPYTKLFSSLSDTAYHTLVFERGVGPTQSCGSGASVIAATVLAEGECPYEAWVPVVMPGGHLFVRQPQEGESITLAGPAEWVFDGVLDF